MDAVPGLGGLAAQACEEDRDHGDGECRNGTF